MILIMSPQLTTIIIFLTYSWFFSSQVKGMFNSLCNHLKHFFNIFFWDPTMNQAPLQSVMIWQALIWDLPKSCLIHHTTWIYNRNLLYSLMFISLTLPILNTPTSPSSHVSKQASSNRQNSNSESGYRPVAEDRGWGDTTLLLGSFNKLGKSDGTIKRYCLETAKQCQILIFKNGSFHNSLYA